MRTLVVFVLFVLCSPQLALADTTATLHRDTVYARYMQRGAWRQPLFSHERIALTDSALKYLPHDAYLWQQRSMPFIKQMKYEVSIQYMDSAVKYDYNRYVGYRGFLKCVFQKDYAGALADLKQAKSIRPGADEMDHPWDYWIGLCYLQLCHYDSAEAALAACVEKDAILGSDWTHYLHTFYLGVAQFERGKFAVAEANFDHTLKRHAVFADAKYYKALCMAGVDRKQQALDLLLDAEKDLAQGRTFDEDSSPYEVFPYQIRKWMVAGSISHLRKSM